MLAQKCQSPQKRKPLKSGFAEEELALDSDKAREDAVDDFAFDELEEDAELDALEAAETLFSALADELCVCAIAGKA